MGWWVGLLVLAGLIGFWAWIVYAIRGITHSDDTYRSPPEPPLAVLDRRLAAGEISPEEYRRLRRALTTGH